MDRRGFIVGTLAAVAATQIGNDEDLSVSCEKGIDVLVIAPGKHFIVKVGSECRPASPCDIEDASQILKECSVSSKDGMPALSFEVREGDRPWDENKKPTSAKIRADDLRNRMVIVRVGSDDDPATAEDILRVQRSMATSLSGRRRQVYLAAITHHAFEVSCA